MNEKVERTLPGTEEFARKMKAQAVIERPIERRFYESVELESSDGTWRVTLDGRPVKTPSKGNLACPTEALARAVASEWQAQGEQISPATMPFTKLVNTALDRVDPDRTRIINEIVSYANSDLLCYRAEQPVGLVARQAKIWNPLLDEFTLAHGGKFTALGGVMHQDQPEETLKAMRNAVDVLTSFQITGLHNAMTLTGSSVMALALTKATNRAIELWTAAHLDEDWQIEQWGEDEDAANQRALREAEFHRTAEFISLLE